MKNIIWIGLGAIIGFLGAKYLVGGSANDKDVIGQGEQSEDVRKLQQSINMLIGKAVIPESGEYDEATMKNAAILFDDTGAMCCQNGGVYRKFINDLHSLLSKLQKVQ
jgi:hypothetical protein